MRRRYYSVKLPPISRGPSKRRSHKRIDQAVHEWKNRMLSTNKFINPVFSKNIERMKSVQSQRSSPDETNEKLSRVSTIKSCLETSRFEDYLSENPEIAPKQAKVTSKSNKLQLYWDKYGLLPNSPMSRFGATFTAVGNSLILTGGQGKARPRQIKIYNPIKKKWKNFPLALPEGRIGHSTVTYKGGLIVYGGYAYFDESNNTRKCFGSVLFVNPERGILTDEGYGEIPTPRRNHCAVRLGRSMLVYGGVDDRSRTLGSLFSLDLVSLRWNSIRCKKSPSSRSHSTFVPIFPDSTLHDNDSDATLVYKPNGLSNNHGVYLFGGKSQDGQAMDDLWVLQFNGKQFEWGTVRARGKHPVSRYDHTACQMNEMLFVYGGRNDKLFIDQGISAIKEVSVLVVKDLRWEQLCINGNAPPARWGHGMAVFEGKIIVFGGMDHLSLKSADVYALSTPQTTLEFN